jgi:hypothetical protein
MASQLKYENVHLDDQDDSSTTEVEESLMGDEKQMHGEEFRERYTRKSKRKTCISMLKEARWFLDTILLLVIVVLLLRLQSQKDIPKTSEHEVGGDLTGVGPHCKELAEISNDSNHLTMRQFLHKSRHFTSTRPLHPTTHQSFSEKKF